MQQIGYKPSTPKEMPTLLTYFAIEGESQNISIEKLLVQIRKLDPTYAGGAPS